MYRVLKGIIEKYLRMWILRIIHRSWRKCLSGVLLSFESSEQYLTWDWGRGVSLGYEVLWARNENETLRPPSFPLLQTKLLLPPPPSTPILITTSDSLVDWIRDLLKHPVYRFHFWSTLHVTVTRKYVNKKNLHN